MEWSRCPECHVQPARFANTRPVTPNQKEFGCRSVLVPGGPCCCHACYFPVGLIQAARVQQASVAALTTYCLPIQSLCDNDHSIARCCTCDSVMGKSSSTSLETSASLSIPCGAVLFVTTPSLNGSIYILSREVKYFQQLFHRNFQH